MATDIATKELNAQPIAENLTKSEIDEIKKYRDNKASKFYLVVKRFIDIIGGFVGCIMMIPISIVIYILNLINNENGPMFYKQKRIGKNGKVFMMYKYRTMVVNADDILEDYLNNHENEKQEFLIYRKLKNDPRITKTGRILRKTSLDEWPQFINVLKGDMSLVGARPYLLKERKYLEDDSIKILTFRPGLTGPWQVAGRSKLTFSDRVKIEKNYVPSFMGDMKIMIATFKKVFNKDGAY